MKNLVRRRADPEQSPVRRYPGLEMSKLFGNPALRAYLANVRDWHGYVRFLGLPDRRDKLDVRIGGLFVWPLLTRRHVSPDENPAHWLDEAEGVLDALMIGKPLMLLGDPGSGKSTLLNYLVWLLGRPAKNALIDRLGWRLPVPMVLRELSLRGVTDFDGLLGAFLDHAMSEPLRNGGCLKEILAKGQAFILLDGIDEVGDPAARANLRRAVFDGFARYPDSLWVLSSRIVGYDEAPFDRNPFDKASLDETTGSPHQAPAVYEDAGEYSNGPASSNHGKAFRRRASRGYSATGRGLDDAAVVTRFIAPFDDKRITAFARKWYIQREAAATRAGADASHLVRAVHADPAILRLARVPNLLTMMALIHRIETTLPHGRALLYDRIAEAYLESIDKSRGLYSGAHDLPQKKLWLARVGYEMQRRRTPAEEADGEAPALRGKAGNADGSEILAESGAVLAWLGAEMDRGGTTVGVGSPEEFLDFVGRRAGLLLPRAEGRYAFIHLSFQEYFAAVALERDVTGIDWARGRRSPLDFSREDLAGWAEQSVWRETFVFLFELLAPKHDWYADLLDCVFGKGFSRLDAPEPGERTLNLACLAARLAVNPRSGLSRAKRQDATESCVRTQLRCQSEKSYYLFLPNIVFGVLLGDDRVRNANVFDVIGKQLRKLKIGRIDLSETRIDDLAPLGDLVGLQWLSLADTAASDLVPLSKLTKLQSLGLSGTPVSDLSPLSNLTALESLDLSRTSVSDITPLADLTKLQSLGLMYTAISDLVPLVNLTGLHRLDLDGTQVSDLSPLSKLIALELLDLRGTTVSNLSPLSNLTALESLDLSGTSVSDITPLANFTKLQSLGLMYTAVSDLVPLANLTGLHRLDLDGTQVSDLSPLSNLTALESLDLRRTSISDLTPLSKLTKLRSLILMDTAVSDLVPLANLTGLHRLDLDGTQVSDLSPLSNLTALESLDLRRTSISDLTPLSKLTKLRSLILMDTEISESEARKLRDALPRCRILT